MLDQASIKKQLCLWMSEFVEVPNVALDNWPPCPYARQARINDKIKIVFVEAQGLCKEVHDNLHWLDTFEVIILCFDHKQIDSTLTQAYVKILNSTLMKENIVVLDDHPLSKEYVNGISMNFNACGLLLVQKLNVLNNASDQLKAKGYYKSWNQKELAEVVLWREHGK